MPNLVTQVHKDFADSIGTARKEVFPPARRGQDDREQVRQLGLRLWQVRQEAF